MNNPDSINLIDELTIYDGEKNIFKDNGEEYIIPLYQRSFAWEEKHIIKLIEDIYDFNEDCYYLGLLIVSKSKDKNLFEVIDGQQRLTALFLLFRSLCIGVENTLKFACRERSDNTLKNIKNLDNMEEIDIDSGLANGIKTINAIINGNINDQKFDKTFFLSKLMKVRLYRVQVPPNTDLNRYFETMNTRGEQLEQSDILKASLMKEITSSINKAKFAEIWEACSDMTGYVQMRFNNTTTRTGYFGSSWNDLPNIDFKGNEANEINPKEKDKVPKIKQIIEQTIKENFDKYVGWDDDYKDEKARTKFESIISFPFLLLHTLKVFAAEKNIQHLDQRKTLIYEMLDDFKLTDTFNDVVNYGVIDGKKISEKPEAKEWFSLEFIECLLKCRFLFDKYIIKREFANENTDGEWSLKQLKVDNKTPYYVNTIFNSKEEQEQKSEHGTETILMMQSCLRVSYTSPKTMHWITELLKWLYMDNQKTLKGIDEYEKLIKGIAASAVKTNYLEKITDDYYNWGTNTPHIVFNYLDYLLWEREQNKYKDFKFEFRNSVEHWYPRNPSDNTFPRWQQEDGVDGIEGFGNLCIIQSGINSRFSNISPEAKKKTFEQMIAKASLKLRIMSELTVGTQEKNADTNWREKVCKEHQQKMLNILKEACSST